MPVQLIYLLVILGIALIVPDSNLAKLDNSLTTVDGVLCRLAPILKPEIGSREGNVLYVPCSDPMVGIDTPAPPLLEGP